MPVYESVSYSTKYQIGDVLFIEQTNGGGLRKTVILDITISLKTKASNFKLSNPVATETKKYTCQWVPAWYNQPEANLVDKIKYHRRGNNWIIPMPKRARVMGTRYMGGRNETL